MSSAGANLPERKAAGVMLGGTNFRRQGLADASERVRGGSGTFKGMNACRKIKDGRSIFPELAT